LRDGRVDVGNDRSSFSALGPDVVKDGSGTQILGSVSRRWSMTIIPSGIELALCALPPCPHGQLALMLASPLTPNLFWYLHKTRQFDYGIVPLLGVRKRMWVTLTEPTAFPHAFSSMTGENLSSAGVKTIRSISGIYKREM